MRFHATFFLLASLLMIVAGCAQGEPDEPVADAVELTPAPEFEPVTPGDNPDTPSLPVPKVDKKASVKKGAKKVIKVPKKVAPMEAPVKAVKKAMK